MSLSLPRSLPFAYIYVQKGRRRQCTGAMAALGGTTGPEGISRTKSGMVPIFFGYLTVLHGAVVRGRG